MDRGINKKLSVVFSEFLMKNEDKITVTALCEKADVARATFYLYYRDIDDFVSKSREYIIQKLFDQMKIIMKASDSELDTVLKRKNIIFADYELVILKYFTNGIRYIEFAVKADQMLQPLFKELIGEKWGEDYYDLNKSKFEYFINGFMLIVYFDLIDYDEETIKYDVHSSRAVAGRLFGDVIDDIRKGTR